mmetsp:Transcript_19333/g.18664  ORF Transcript_19333/g.18664 Transcript_19333/m.18664 type:complete len:281 (+) Transcript_19333:116-958(+)
MFTSSLSILLVSSLYISSAFAFRIPASILSQNRLQKFAHTGIKSKTLLKLNEIENEVSDRTLTTEEEEDNLLIERLNAEIMLESGVELDQLINPSKVVNLERDLFQLNKQIKLTTDVSEIAEIQKVIDKKSATLIVEKRGVMRGWLKNLFVGQSVLAGGGSLAIVYQVIPTELPIQVLGFWMWWLFIIPSLRARKPKSPEKEALDIAFLLSPVVSLIMPSLTKDTAIIWWANAVAVAGCYAFAYLKPKEEGEDKSLVPEFISKGIKALDYGSGKERGERK